MASSSFSCWTGQAALQSLPPPPSSPSSKGTTIKRSLASYPLPETLVQDRSSLAEGLPVLKVTKTGKLQVRRFAFTQDRKAILVTSNKIDFSRKIGGWFKSVRDRSQRSSSSSTNNNNHFLTGDSSVSSSSGTKNVPAKQVPLPAIDRIQRGAHSKRFALARQEAIANDETEVLMLLEERDEPACLTIVYRVSNDATGGAHQGISQTMNRLNPQNSANTQHNGYETLDLIVPKATDYEVLFTALDDLTNIYRQQQQYYTFNLQALQNAWTDVLGKDWESAPIINHNDWLSLCDKMQVPLKKSTVSALFKDETLNKTDEKIYFQEAASLIEMVKKHAMPPDKNILERIWKDILATDPVPNVELQDNDAAESNLEIKLQKREQTVSNVAFLSFLRSQQKEYQTSLEQATDLVHTLNQKITIDNLLRTKNIPSNTDERLTKSRFFSFLLSDANDIMNPIKATVGADDMTHPLSHYWINTSHDTYLSSIPASFHGKSAYSKFARLGGFQNVDEQSYSAALWRGVRCLEIDLWDGLEQETGPMVSRHAPTPDRNTPAYRITLASVCKQIRSFLREQPYSFPILLKLENHCSPRVQGQVAKILHDVLGETLCQPEDYLSSSNLDDAMTLPSPVTMQGKCIIIGKRPRRIAVGRTVHKDDFDEDNDVYRGRQEAMRDLQTMVIQEDEGDDESEDMRVVVGFNAKGPIRTNAPDAFFRTPDELLKMAEEECAMSRQEAKEAEARSLELHDQAEEQEKRAAHLTHHSGLSPAEVKRRAAKIGSPTSSPKSNHDEWDPSNVQAGEEKSAKDEGLEIHDVLPEFVQNNRNVYEKAAKEASDAAEYEALCHAVLREKEDALNMARANLEMSRQRERTVMENAKKASFEAHQHREHSESAKQRVERVRELLRECLDQSSSAGTVVQTALTEAKISEKRAAEAEARAARAQQAADNDRRRADTETKREEDFEQEVNMLHDKCLKATELAKDSKSRIDKAAAMLDRVTAEIKSIESSSVFKKEMRATVSDSDMLTLRQTGSVMTVYKERLQERDIYRKMMKQASEENSEDESNRTMYQRDFEEKAYEWKLQADLAAQARKTADRSSQVADELSEHAEEEREAANLRHIARQRAEATVESKGSYRASIEAQLKEAEKASAEAADLAVQSRKRAEYLLKETEKVKDHSRFEKTVEECEVMFRLSKSGYDAARLDRELKDKIMSEEKRRLDTNSEVCQMSDRNAAAECDRERVERMYQQEAVVAYNQAIAIRQEANQAAERVKSATYKAEIKRLAAKRAKEYKEKMDTLVETPVELARLTFLHTAKHHGWHKSLLLSSAYVHSFAQNVLLQMIGSDPDEQRTNLHSFTKNHIVRVFPSWRYFHEGKKMTNYDPVFAWALGCQCVAMNLHSPDENVLVSDGRFRQNGSCGYVLKPAFLTDNITRVEGDQHWTFTVLAGFNLPKPIRKMSAATVSTFVKVSLYTGSEKETRISYKTRVCSNNGLNPHWTSSNRFEFSVPRPSVSMICFSVWHKHEDTVGGVEDFIAAAAIPVSCIREGFRSVALFDANHARTGAYATSCLFVKALKS